MDGAMAVSDRPLRPGASEGRGIPRLDRRPPVTAASPGGFTLVELLVVVGVIALLAGMLMPSLDSARALTLRMRCSDNLRHVNAAVSMYLQANRETYPCAQDPVSVSPFYWLWMGRGWRRFVEPYLGGRVDKDKPSVLFCQGDPKREDYEATSYAYSMAFYHSPEQIDQMNSSADTYSGAKPSVPQTPFSVAEPHRKVLLGEWTSNHPRVSDDSGWWCWRGARTFLFADGHVRYLRAEEIRPARDGLPNPNLTVHGIRGRDL